MVGFIVQHCNKISGRKAPSVSDHVLQSSMLSFCKEARSYKDSLLKKFARGLKKIRLYMKIYGQLQWGDALYLGILQLYQ